MEDQTIEQLKARENEIWQNLQNVCEDSTQAEISELIEINIELETRSNG